MYIQHLRLEFLRYVFLHNTRPSDLEQIWGRFSRCYTNVKEEKRFKTLQEYIVPEFPFFNVSFTNSIIFMQKVFKIFQKYTHVEFSFFQNVTFTNSIIFFQSTHVEGSESSSKDNHLIKINQCTNLSFILIPPYWYSEIEGLTQNLSLWLPVKYLRIPLKQYEEIFGNVF